MVHERARPGVLERRLPYGEEIDFHRLGGMTYTEIAEQYGVSRQAVHKAHMRWLARNLPSGVVIDRMLKDGKDWQDIGEEYDTAPWVVKRVHGIWLRRKLRREELAAKG